MVFTINKKLLEEYKHYGKITNFIDIVVWLLLVFCILKISLFIRELKDSYKITSLYLREMVQQDIVNNSLQWFIVLILSVVWVSI